MDNQPIRDQHILEAIEACRPGSDDVADPGLESLADRLEANPELKDLYERLQRVDAKLAAGFQDVPVPEGLAQRIADRLAAARAEEPALTEAEELGPPADEPAAVISLPPKRISRRRVLAIGGPLAVAASLLVAALIYFTGSKPHSESDVLEAAVGLFKEEVSDPGDLLDEIPPRANYQFSRAVVRVPKIRWRSISDFLGENGVAYSMPGRQATLYVVRCTVADLPTGPPSRPQYTTGGYFGAAWQEGKLLCVLVVRGNTRAYGSYLVPRGPLT